MKTYLKVLAITMIVLWAVISFIGLQPNILTWTTGDRAAYLITGLIVSLFVFAAVEYANENK